MDWPDTVDFGLLFARSAGGGAFGTSSGTSNISAGVRPTDFSFCRTRVSDEHEVGGRHVLRRSLGSALRPERVLCNIYFSHVSKNTSPLLQGCRFKRRHRGTKAPITIVRNANLDRGAGHGASQPKIIFRASSRRIMPSVTNGVVCVAVLEATRGDENRALTLGGKQIHEMQRRW